jgi:hypothetical protein
MRSPERRRRQDSRNLAARCPSPAHEFRLVALVWQLCWQRRQPEGYSGEGAVTCRRGGRTCPLTGQACTHIPELIGQPTATR